MWILKPSSGLDEPMRVMLILTQIEGQPLHHHTTASIPLPPVYTYQTKQLSLADSLKLQQDQDRRLKDIQLKHAADRLASSKGLVNLV